MTSAVQNILSAWLTTKVTPPAALPPGNKLPAPSNSALISEPTVVNVVEPAKAPAQTAPPVAAPPAVPTKSLVDTSNEPTVVSAPQTPVVSKASPTISVSPSNNEASLITAAPAAVSTPPATKATETLANTTAVPKSGVQEATPATPTSEALGNKALVSPTPQAAAPNGAVVGGTSAR